MLSAILKENGFLDNLLIHRNKSNMVKPCTTLVDGKTVSAVPER